MVTVFAECVGHCDACTTDNQCTTCESAYRLVGSTDNNLIACQGRFKKILFSIFGGYLSFFLRGHRYPCFGRQVTPALGFKARVGPSVTCVLRHFWKIWICYWIYVCLCTPLIFALACESNCIRCGDSTECWECKSGEPDVAGDVGYYLSNQDCFGECKLYKQISQLVT